MMKIKIAYSPAPRQVCEWAVVVPAGCTARQALTFCSVLVEFEELTDHAFKLGIWGKRCSLNQLLEENDRIEIYRPLRVDPKVARRERFTNQGAKRAGLFANKRAGAKAGYGG